ncbi:hypothetical protein [Methylobacterium sp. ID0610]|uniref:hypothetical protein n=1 Tax=Methylobacterium carpenticola TaxID=3344827 RepID=UPI00367DF145
MADTTSPAKPKAAAPAKRDPAALPEVRMTKTIDESPLPIAITVRDYEVADFEKAGWKRAEA